MDGVTVTSYNLFNLEGINSFLQNVAVTIQYSKESGIRQTCAMLCAVAIHKICIIFTHQRLCA